MTRTSSGTRTAASLPPPGGGAPAAAPLLTIDGISERAFERFRAFLFESAGISLSSDKQSMVAARLGKRLRHHGLSCFDAYFDLVIGGGHPAERQMALDLLTTHETYFFREPAHLDFLRERILPEHRDGKPFRVWSAASSSGEEAYSIAMLLADRLNASPWEVMGSDISASVLETARDGHYRMDRIDGIPTEYLKRFCLKGRGDYEGTLLIDRALRERVVFQQINLLDPPPNIGPFDVIFLRNVLIYFNREIKQRVISRLPPALRPGGHLFIGHSETLKGIHDSLELVAPTIYRRPMNGGR